MWIRCNPNPGHKYVDDCVVRAIAIAIGGEVVPTSIAAATPTVAEAYWNVSGFAIVDVPSCCCYTVAVENASVSADPATTPAPAILMRNLNVEVTRLA